MHPLCQSLIKDNSPHEFLRALPGRRRLAPACLVLLLAFFGNSRAQAQCAGTPESLAQNGLANLWRSQGMYQLYASQAAINYEEARARYLASQDQEFYNRLKRKEAADAYRAKLKARIKSESPETKSHIARSDAPALLGPLQLNPQSGEIAWPRALLDHRYQATRSELNELFADRAQLADPAENQAKIRAACKRLTTQLKSHVQDPNVSGNDYMNARKFLESLAYTAEQEVCEPLPASVTVSVAASPKPTAFSSAR
jgi:hypothetical protein